MSNNFKLPSGLDEFLAFSVCPSSKLQLLQWLPTQWLWNGKFAFFSTLSLKSWEQASPQKQLSAITLLAKMPNKRNKTSNTLNVFRFRTKIFTLFFIIGLIIPPLIILRRQIWTISYIIRLNLNKFNKSRSSMDGAIRKTNTPIQRFLKMIDLNEQWWLYGAVSESPSKSTYAVTEFVK